MKIERPATTFDASVEKAKKDALVEGSRNFAETWNEYMNPIISELQKVLNIGELTVSQVLNTLNNSNDSLNEIFIKIVQEAGVENITQFIVDANEFYGYVGRSETFPTIEEISAFFQTGSLIKEGKYKGYKLDFNNTCYQNLPMIGRKESLNLKRNIIETKEGLNNDLQIFKEEVRAGRMTQEEFDTFEKENKLPEKYYTDMGAIKRRIEAGEYGKDRAYIEYVKNRQGTTFAVRLYSNDDNRCLHVDIYEVPDYWNYCNHIFLN